MNDMQRQAVFCTEGPLLILAGAGSGKTTVLVNRIAFLVKYGQARPETGDPVGLTEDELVLLRRAAQGTASPEETEMAARLFAIDPCPAWRILAITFTNKAAGELRDRLERILGGQDGRDVMASTFHSFCARILRRDGDRVGYSRSFTIYDTDDSRRLMKECMKQLDIEEKMFPHKSVLSEIGRAKDRLLNPQEFAEDAGQDYRLKQIAKCYELYQQKLRDADAMDFDDLLCTTVRLFRENADVLEYYQNRFRYMMVDEYQDTNHAQYEFIGMLAAKAGNLCVVGDDDQSIYKFRGATIENILSFEENFSGCRAIRLEQNYRSTQNILNAANAVISHNISRKSKTLWTENPEGDKITVRTSINEDEEGKFIADTVFDGVAKGMNYSDFAVLYRANAQSNAIERALVKNAIPYRIIGGHRFYDSREVKDAMAYLRVINNPDDEVALRRIINEPKRSIGTTTVDKAAGIASGQGFSLFEVLCRADEYADLSRAATKIKLFTDMILRLREMESDMETSLHLLYTTMLEISGYLAMWQQAGDEGKGRVENLNELASSILNYENNSAEEALPELSGFLEEAALMTDVDNYDMSADTLILMTMHAAKGLEFPVVMLPGFEDGIFPGMQTMFDPSELEEDRRLCYVAITRAKQKLYILNAQSRMLYGSTTRNRPSRFIADIPSELTEVQRQPVTQTRSTGGGISTYSSAAYEKSAKPAKPYGIGLSVGQTAPSTPPADRISWNAGDRVHHKVFGDGEIQTVTSMGNDSLLKITFVTAGEKKIMANFAKLTQLD